jgi:hypothetical protein
MASAQAFTWTIAPDQQLIPNLKGYGDKVWAAIGQLADLFSARMEAYAKQNAPWTDRTGAARAGLRGFTVKAAASVVLYLVHSVSYGVFLELGTRRMSPRPIIMPTLEQNYAPLMSALRDLVAA